MDDIQVIKIFDSRLEAEIAKTILNLNGITSCIEADDEGGMTPFPFSITFGAKLMVHIKDLRKAAEILEKQPQ